MHNIMSLIFDRCPAFLATIYSKCTCVCVMHFTQLFPIQHIYKCVCPVRECPVSACVCVCACGVLVLVSALHICCLCIIQLCVFSMMFPIQYSLNMVLSSPLLPHIYFSVFHLLTYHTHTHCSFVNVPYGIAPLSPPLFHR